jgi:glyoxylase-like metal-dependent hydrolase (beta-lactamase superfamily II)
MMLGDFAITALCDGTIDFPMDRILTSAKPGEVDALLAEAYLKPPVRTSCNQFLINKGSKLVLVDAGAGMFLGPSLGNMLTNLRAAGYEPGQVDEVLITHMHVDHVGGLVHKGRMAFPNATVRVDKNDVDYWLDEAKVDKTDEGVRANVEANRASFAPYVAAGKLEPFNGDTDLMPGIKTIAAHGHTPGHNFYQVDSKGQRLVLWGDTVHAAAVQFADPSVTVQWDSNAKQAEAQRQKAFADAARQGYLAGGAHTAFPGIGHVRAQGKSYAWVPVNYSASL